MTKLEKLGKKCTNTRCHNNCPVYYFKHEGIGKGTGNGCVEALRFPQVARAVELWMAGKKWSKEELNKWEDE